MTSSDAPDRPDRDDIGPPPADDLDALLRTWHWQHADRAEALRGQLMHQLTDQNSEQAGGMSEPQAVARGVRLRSNRI